MTSSKTRQDTERSRCADLAPWVVPLPQPSSERLLVGPRMTLLRIRKEVTGDELAAAGHNDFVLASPVVREPGPPQPVSSRGLDLILLDLIRRPSVGLLLDELTRQGLVVTVAPPDSNILSGSARTPVMVIADREPVSPPAWMRIMMRSRPVLWAGECSDGTHIGPLISTEKQLADYLAATSVWASDRTLRELGMRERPLPLLSGAPTRSHSIARAVTAALGGAGSGRAVLVDGTRAVTLWTAARDESRPPEELLGELRWAKGLIKDLATESAPDKGVHLVSCRTPCGVGTAELESNSGKGPTARQATERALGESAERFAAWQANTDSGPRRHARRYHLAEFHPFGPLYETYRQNGSPEIEWTTATSLISGEKFDVPACLVAFPYMPSPGHSRPSWGDTTGLASYPNRGEAVLRGLREVLERDSFYPNFMRQRPGTLLRGEPGGTPSGRQTFCLMYPDAIVPIVHAFIVECARGSRVVARGSGSGLSWREARSRALEEADQILAQSYHGRGILLGNAFDAWGRHDVTSELLRYLSSLPEADPVVNDSGSAAEQLRSLTETLGTAGRDVLVADLPNPVRGWTAVRVLISGATCNQWVSESTGGQRLRGAVWHHGIPA